MREWVINIDYGLNLLVIICLSYFFLSEKIKKSPADTLIFQILFLHATYSIFNWFLKYYQPYPVNAYFVTRLLFPAFIIFQIFVKNKGLWTALLTLLLIIALTFLLDTAKVKEMMHHEFKYAFILPAIATVALFYKTMDGVKNPHFHHYYFVILTGLLTCETFFSAVWSRIIQFDMETWLKFITSFAIFVGFMYLTALYYFIRKYVLR